MESALRDWTLCFNANDFEGALKHYSFPSIHNGQEIKTGEEHLSFMKRMKGTFPEHKTEIDFVIVNHDDSNQDKLMAARLIVTAGIEGAGKAHFGFDPSGPKVIVRVQDLWLVRFTDDGDPEHPKFKELITIPDVQAMHAQLANPSSTVTDVFSQHILKQITPTEEEHDLAGIVRKWAAHIADKACAAHAEDFMHEQVYHWTRGRLNRTEMAVDLDSMLSSAGDVQIDLDLVVVDPKKQQVAVRHTMHTVLIKPLGGVEANGKKIAISEICIYQFQGSKIFAIWALIDMMGVVQQMKKND